MKTVITYGTFDIFHVGHLNLLCRAKTLGDRLVVGISTDEFNKMKGKTCFFPYEQRAQIVRALEAVDDVIPEHSWEQKALDIARESASTLVMGDDWRGRFDDLGRIVEVVYLPRTVGISTTEIKTSIRGISKEQIDALKNAVDLARSVVNSL